MSERRTSVDSPDTLFDVDSLLDDDEKAIRRTVRQVVDDRVKPYVAEWYERGHLPARELAKQLGEVGLLGMHLEGYGCAGMSATAYGLACLELEAGDSGIRSLVSVQGSLAMFAIHAYGSEEQKHEWLPRMATGDAIGCFGLTEPDHGCDPAGMRTVAKRGRRRLGAERHEDVDHERVRRRCRRRLVPHGRRHPRIRGAHRLARLLRQRDHLEDVTACVGDERAGARRRPPAVIRGAAWGDGAARPARPPAAIDRGSRSVAISARTSEPSSPIVRRSGTGRFLLPFRPVGARFTTRGQSTAPAPT